MSPDRKIRVLVAKPGLDGHDRGAKVIARALRDAGMEVIYTGLRQTPEMIVNASLQEDVDVIGLSILSGAHNAIVPRVMDLLKQNQMDDVLVLVGGIIPDQDVEALKKGGVAAVFQPGTPMDSIIEFIRANVKPRGVPARKAAVRYSLIALQLFAIRSSPDETKGTFMRSSTACLRCCERRRTLVIPNRAVSAGHTRAMAIDSLGEELRSRPNSNYLVSGATGMAGLQRP